MAEVAHPSIVRVFDVGEDDDQTWIVMELCEGRTLADALASPPPLAQRIAWLVDIASALQAAHALGVVHRDLKPSNVLLRADGRVAVSDFGIAVQRDHVPSSTHAHTAPGGDGTAVAAAHAGTPLYMAPEQHRGGSVDARTDVFAFSAMAWQLLYGVRPFANARSTSCAVRRSRARLAIRRPSRARVDRTDPAARARPAARRSLAEHGRDRAKAPARTSIAAGHRALCRRARRARRRCRLVGAGARARLYRTRGPARALARGRADDREPGGRTPRDRTPRDRARRLVARGVSGIVERDRGRTSRLPRARPRPAARAARCDRTRGRRDRVSHRRRSRGAAVAHALRSGRRARTGLAMAARAAGRAGVGAPVGATRSLRRRDRHVGTGDRSGRRRARIRTRVAVGRARCDRAHPGRSGRRRA